MWRAWVAIGWTGCASIGPWDYTPGILQSTTGSRPIVTVHADDAPRYLTIECAGDGLQLSVGERQPATPIQLDDRAPEAWPTTISARGVPVIDLRTPIAGGSTAEQRLVGAKRLRLRSGLDAGAATVATFDVSRNDRAIRRLRCP